MTDTETLMKKRFDGYLPVVLDVETGGLDPIKNALLEVAAVTVDFNAQAELQIREHFSTHVEAFKGAKLNPQSMEINKIDPDHPFRFAMSEAKALTELFNFVSQALIETDCRRAILVGHNAHFDLSFILAACQRCQLESPFHSFTVFDTATLGGLAYGKTVLAKILKKAGIAFDKNQAHSALYDAQKTAELFCQIINRDPG
ncbi:MAG: ribonuclease T [Gammaproteobacteria bacterium]|nr:ribonuclease T [Gammaproteobacteria bacterium]